MAPDVDDELEELAGLDGVHHYWCKVCHPEWVPLGPPRGVEFTAFCGVRAVLLVTWQSDDEPPGVCLRCARIPRCVTCGHR